MAVDKYFRCYVNPKFLDQCRELAAEVSASNPCTSCGAEKHHPIAYIGGVICHEAWHVLRTHHDRARTNDAITAWLGYLWNVGADMEINDGLIEVFQHAPKVPNKLCLPPIQTEVDKTVNKTGVLLPQSEGFPDGKLVEEYYNLLKDKAEDEKEKNPDGKEPGEEGECGTCGGTGVEPPKSASGGKEEGDGDGSGGEGGESGGCQETGIGSGKGGQQACPDCHGSGKSFDKIFGEADSGSGADGQERGYEEGEPGPDNPMSGLSEIEARMVRKEVAKEIREAVKNRGNVPGGWKLWADEELGVPKYDWRSELRKVLSRSIHTIPGDSVRTFRRLSRRCSAIGHKAILPSHRDSAPQVCIVQDTSGSMGVDNMRSSLEETKGLLKAVQAGVTYINCDAAADKAQAVTSVRNIDLHGGGGTDMRVGIKAALDSYPDPDVIILFTDGYTPWPDNKLPKGIQLVVCLVGQSACDANDVPSWCKVVKIVDEIVDTREARF
jgi:predicted metal-dependent peptidase